jgi:beta-phosphoglucomutase-like phosphatase (HAD superfamily)
VITDVGLDLDGVMFDFSSVATEEFSLLLNKPLTHPTTWEFYREPAWGLSKGEFYDLLEKVTVEREIFDRGALIEGTQEGWKMLRNMGVNIHIITHRSKSAMSQTTRWLERYNMLPDGLYFTESKAMVLDAIRDDEAVAIDDNWHQCFTYQNMDIKSFLYTQPWNRAYSHRRVSSLVDFAQYIRTYNEYCILEESFLQMGELI